ncbi:MAG: WD40 repeat domain-containing protein [Candidatus Methylacidiphilales bacterium]|nr:WD40 repeat domain-containing protein [Candidatus Methylacidiphilales bacterium]
MHVLLFPRLKLNGVVLVCAAVSLIALFQGREAQAGKTDPQPQVRIHSEAMFYAAVFSPDGKYILTGSGDGTARLWNSRTGAQIGPVMRHSEAEIPPSPPEAIAAGYGGYLGMYGGPFDLGWLYGLGFCPRPHDPSQAKIPAQHRIETVAFSPDGKLIATGSTDGTARIWERKGNVCKRIGALINPEAYVYTIEFSSDGARLLVAASRNEASLWEARTGKSLGSPMTHQNVVRWAAFSADGKRVVTASWDTTARVWDATTGKPITEPLIHPAEQGPFLAAMTLDGARVITMSYRNALYLWDVATGKQIGEPMLHDKLASLKTFAISPDGTRIVSAANDGTALLWDARTGKQIGSPMLHKDAVFCVSFSPDSTRFVTGTESAAFIWNARDSTLIGPPLPHPAAVMTACFSPDGTRLATTSYMTPQGYHASVWNVKRYSASAPGISSSHSTPARQP